MAGPFEHVNLGSTFVDSLAKSMAERRALARQQFLDSITQREMTLKEKQQASVEQNRQDILDEKKRQDDILRAENMSKGLAGRTGTDVPTDTANLLDKQGFGYMLAHQAAAPPIPEVALTGAPLTGPATQIEGEGPVEPSTVPTGQAAEVLPKTRTTVAPSAQEAALAKLREDLKGVTDPKEIERQLVTSGAVPASDIDSLMRIYDPSRAAAGSGAYNLEKDVRLYKGKPVDVMVDPRSQKVYLQTPEGQVDVTGQTSHYEKAPTETLVPTGVGYDTKANILRRLQSGEHVPLAATAQTRGQMDAAQQVEPKIAEVQGLAQQLNDAGVFGPVMTRIRNLAVKAGTIDEFASALANDPDMRQLDPLAGQFAVELALLASGSARVHFGGNAGRSQAAIQAFRDMLSDAGTIELFGGRLKGLDSFLTTYANGPGGGNGKPAAKDAPSATTPKTAEELRKQYGY